MTAVPGARTRRAFFSGGIDVAAAVTTALAVGLAGCAPAPPPPPSPPPPPVWTVAASTPKESPADATEPRETIAPEAREIRLAVVADAARPDVGAAGKLVRIGLVRAGYLVVDGPQEHDAQLQVDLDRGSTAAEADAGDVGRLSVRLLHDGAVAQWLVTPLGSHAQRAEEVRDIVDRLTTSPGLAEVARSASRSAADRRGARYAASVPVPAATPPSTDESGFTQVAARRCRNDGNAAACATLADYVAAYPNGRHAATAKAVLEIRSARAR